jgi:hypothetical protein
LGTLAPSAGLVVCRVPIESLFPDPANARLPGPENLAAIRSSLARFQQVEPLVVQQSTQRLIAGHGRLEAMRSLGWSEVDIVELEVDDVQAAALALALNRTGELASWDEPALARILRSLQSEGGIEDLGWSTDELAALARSLDAPEPTEVDDQGPEEPPENPVARLGDLWTIGAHRLLCGDSTSSDDVVRVMQGATARLLSTDSPYCVGYSGNDRPADKDGKPSGKAPADSSPGSGGTGPEISAR